MAKIRPEQIDLAGVAKALRTLRQGSPKACSFFGTILLLNLLVTFWLLPHPTNFQIDLARFFLALCAAFLCIFFFGGIVLQGTLKGMGISAVGAFVVFILLQFVVDPLESMRPPHPPVAHNDIKQIYDSYLTETFDQKNVDQVTFRDGFRNAIEEVLVERIKPECLAERQR